MRDQAVVGQGFPTRGVRRMTGRGASDADDIEIRIGSIAQLFHSLDPSPFHEKDLDKDAEQFIVSWARELPAGRPFRIVVHLPEEQIARPEAQAIPAAIGQFFVYRAQAIGLELKELFRVGRRALAIELTILFLCVIASQAVTARTRSEPARQGHRRELAHLRVGGELAAD